MSYIQVFVLTRKGDGTKKTQENLRSSIVCFYCNWKNYLLMSTCMVGREMQHILYAVAYIYTYKVYWKNDMKYSNFSDYPSWISRTGLHTIPEIAAYTFLKKYGTWMNLSLCLGCLNFINICTYLKVFMKDQKRVTSFLFLKEQATLRSPGPAEY